MPLRKRISEEQLLRYYGMLISVFELLADAREQVASVNAAIESLREFWTAEADLQRSLNGAGRRARRRRGESGGDARVRRARRTLTDAGGDGEHDEHETKLPQGRRGRAGSAPRW